MQLLAAFPQRLEVRALEADSRRSEDSGPVQLWRLPLSRGALGLKGELHQMIDRPRKQPLERRHELQSHFGPKESAFVIGPVLPPALAFFFEEGLEIAFSHPEERADFGPLANGDSSPMRRGRSREKPPQKRLRKVIRMVGREKKPVLPARQPCVDLFPFLASELFPGLSFGIPLRRERLQAERAEFHAKFLGKIAHKGHIRIGFRPSPPVVYVHESDSAPHSAAVFCDQDSESGRVQAARIRN